MSGGDGGSEQSDEQLEFVSEVLGRSHRPASSDPATARLDDGPTHSIWRRAPVAISLSLVCMAVVLIALTVRANLKSSPDHPGATLGQFAGPAVGATPTPGEELSQWVASNVSLSAVIVSDDASVAALDGAGFHAAVSYEGSAGRDLQTLDYVVWIPGTSTTDRITQLLDSSLPLAIFGPTLNAPEVRQVFAAGEAAALQLQARDKASRSSGGIQLAQNPRITVDAASLGLVRGGGLDLRAEVVSVTLASASQIWLSVDAEDAAERQAGLPARSVTITAQDPAALAVTLTSLASPYKPAAVVSIAPNKVQLIWSPQIAPVTIVGK